MSEQIAHYINGLTISSTSSRLLVVTNPALGIEIAKVGVADAALVNQAVMAAKQAFPAWSATPPQRRARVLFEFKNLLEKHLDELAGIVTREHGKTLSDAKGSVQRGIEVVELACGIPTLLKSSFTENVATAVDSYSMRQALGVCVGITPFNFPAMIPLWMFAMAIACGNTFVLKPSEKNPSCALRLAELFKAAGLPDGVLNVVHGDKETVQALLIHPDVKAISFVGSSAVAESVYLTGTQHGKRVQAFGGAKNHCVVMPDADIEQVSDALLGAAFGSAGERCMAISVAVVVGDAMADQLVEKLKPRVAAVRMGVGTDPTVEMGPLISAEHKARVSGYVELGVKEGAKLIVDGRGLPSPAGFFLGASLFDHVNASMKIYQEEIFGPVLCVVRVPDFMSALALVNDHPYGNGVAIYTRDGGVAREFASLVQVGMIGINVAIPVPPPFQSFGGWKRSFFGDIGMHGSESVQFYTHTKVITTRWPDAALRHTEFTISSLK